MTSIDSRSRTAAICKVVAWNVGILLAGLVVIELIFGNWLFGQNLGLLMVPRNVRIFHVLKELPGAPTVRYTRDRYGLRGDYDKPGDIEVLVVGGSTTNELYVGDGETFVDVLRAELAAAGVPMVIVNAGVDGHSTVGHLRAFDVWFPRIPNLSPKWVVFYVGINDVAVAAQARYDDSIAERGGAIQRLIRRFKNDSALCQLYRIVRGAIRAKDLRMVHGIDVAPKEFPVELRPEDRRVAVARLSKPKGLSQYRERLYALVRATENWGAKPVFVTQRRGDVRYSAGILRGASESAIDLQLKLERVNAVTLSVCAQTAAACVDLGKEIRFHNGDFYDPIHTSPQGSRRIGVYLAQKLKPLFHPQ